MRNLLCLIVLNSALVYADGMAALDSFLQNKNSTISANFSQTVFGTKKNKTSSGTMQIARPNKFRWQYNEDGQLIVCDGKRVYIYDEPLQQVTQKKLDGLLGKSPALLLAGGSNIKKVYNAKSQPESGMLEWVSLTPKDAKDNNGFKSIQLGFSKNTNNLEQMKFVDSFDNRSAITFSNVKTGASIPDSTFKFTVPRGVDVINSDSN